MVPANKLSSEQRGELIRVVNSQEYRDLPPAQIVPALADRGLYLASEATIYRILREEKQLAHRRNSRRPQRRSTPRELKATGPNQVWSWDITYLRCWIRGRYYYLYMIVDIYSRKIVAWQVHERESADYAAALIRDAARQEGIDANQVILHSDNGSPMKGATMLATLQSLGIAASFSRPAVSNDNPFSESLFGTLKGRPAYPQDGFEGHVEAYAWVRHFVDWYNHRHLHSGLKYVTPHQRHTGADREILSKRHQVYQQAMRRDPQRWSGATRNWSPAEATVHNPGKSIKGSRAATGAA
jgi:transposase InsO family protein